jgi:hypothetical protein
MTAQLQPVAGTGLAPIASPYSQFRDGKAVQAGLLVAGGLLGVALAWLLLTYGEAGRNLFSPVMALAAVILVPIIFRRPVIGVYILMATGVIIEEAPLKFGDSLTDQLPLFHDINGIIAVRGVYVNPAEVLMVVTAIGLLLKSSASGRPRLVGGPVFIPFTAFMAMIAFGVVHGVLTGGDLKISLWTTRGLAYFYISYLLTVNIIQNRRQVNALLWIIILGVAIKAVTAWWRYSVNLGGDLSQLRLAHGSNSLMAHEESFFFVAVIILAAVQLLYGSSGKQRALTLLTLPLVVFAFLANQRRVGALALLAALLVLAFITYGLLRERRRLIANLLIVAAVVAPVYGAVMWNSTSLAAEPVQAIKSGFQPDARDFESDVYREAENVNLEFTVRQSPLVGIGFGKEMVMHWPLADVAEFFLWYKIVPHNSILWIMMTTGIFGFLLFWYWVGATLIRGCLAARQLVSRANQGVVVYALVMLVALLMFGLYDQGLMSMRACIFEGILIGVALISPRLAKGEESQGDVDSASEAPGPVE